MNYDYQGFKDFGDPLKAEQLILMEDNLIAHQNALNTCISTQPLVDWVGVDQSTWTVTSQYYWGASHSKVGPYSTWQYITIPVTGNETYKIKSIAGQAARQYYFYSTPEPLADAILDFSTDSSTASQREVTVTAPEGSVIMIVNHRTDGTLSIQKQKAVGTAYQFDLEKSGVNAAIAAGGGGGGNSGGGSTSVASNDSNILYGKILVTVGDSITQGADMNLAPETDLSANPNYSTNTNEGKFKTYGWQIANRNNMIFYNKGISGTTMQGTTNSAGTDKGDISKKNGFSKPGGRYTQLPDEIDYLTIMFGWNDAAYGTLGTIDDTTPETYYGGFNVTLPYLIYKYPYTTIILMVPFGATKGHRDAVRQMAEKWGVGLFDKNDDDKLPFYYTDEEETPNIPLNTTIKNIRTKLHQINGAHPGYEGHYIISTRLENYMRQCGCYDRKNAIMWNVSYSTAYGTAPTAKKAKIIYDDLLPTLTASGKTFGGWYTNSELTTKATIGTILNADTTLYAKWS